MSWNKSQGINPVKAQSSKSLDEIKRIWCERSDDIGFPMTLQDPTLSSARTCDSGESENVHRQLRGTSSQETQQTTDASQMTHRQRRSAEQLVLAEVIEKIRETNPELCQDLMAINDPCTTAVLYIQLCVKAARSTDNPISERKRDKISKDLTDDEMWRLDQLSVQFTTCEQRVEVVKALLQTEAKLASLDVTENFGLRFPQFWYFMSKYNICETAVRFRRSLAPPESRRKRVMSTRQASTLSM
mmetsp:Transcript_57948/g.154428  ORF Transcript_57948/g.154428 Transcript_57948/m.154428 type:complete len:244 (-) Transcript_57948:586-1317(-)